MTPDVLILMGTAATLGATHTAVGVDHTLPFVMLGRARRWSLLRTLALTAGCGLAHVMSSVVIGVLGFWGLGLTLEHVEGIEASRGQWAAWLLIGFGVVYAAVGLWRLRRFDGHRHVHVHADGTVHTHAHSHGRQDSNVVHHHEHGPLRRGTVVPTLFIVFVLGPCEALIPLMAAPAAAGELWAPASIALVFGLATVSTMLALVAIGYLGLTLRAAQRLEPHMHWLAGVAIAMSGLGVELLGI
jgi:hypothetical protein